MWIDSHCHINDEAFDIDREGVLERMIEADVRRAMIVSLNRKELEFSRTIRKEGIDFALSVGVFPEDSYQFPEEEKKAVYEEFTKEDVNAIGEIGLDYYWDKEHKDVQKEVFLTQLRMAKELKKPVIIHSRDAAEDTFRILKESGVKGVMHCYSGSKEMALEYVKLGFYISLSGVLTFKNAKEPLAVAEAVPLDRLLIETDCPYLTPVPYRGKRNEPSYVVYTGRHLAKIRNIPEEELQRILEENYRNLFSV